MAGRILKSLAMLLLGICLTAQPAAAADARLVVRNVLGITSMKTTCLLLGCKVQYGLGDPNGQVLLITVPEKVNLVTFIVKLLLQPGVVGVEIDLKSDVEGDSQQIPSGLYDRTPVSYGGSTVWRGFVEQPARDVVRAQEAISSYGLQGTGVVVAVIDTGVDPTHPAFSGALVSGYDFTRNSAKTDEKNDVSQSTAAVLDKAYPWFVNQSTAAVLDQSTAAVLDDRKYAGFGHGTMVAGIVRLVAPKAKIMPLKAFAADGSGFTSDIIRAIYFATKNNARVINMSFSSPVNSPEMRNAINYATGRGVVTVSSAGNEGQRVLMYPAALDNVIGVGSTTLWDSRADFSNYGSTLVWVAAPGEAIIAPYPYGTYAAAWGTSFSTPMVAGAAALLVEMGGGCNEDCAADSVGDAVVLTEELGHGRLDVVRALRARKTALGGR